MIRRGTRREDNRLGNLGSGAGVAGAVHAVEALQVLRRGSGPERDLNDVATLRRDELQAWGARRRGVPVSWSACGLHQGRTGIRQRRRAPYCTWVEGQELRGGEAKLLGHLVERLPAPETVGGGAALPGLHDAAREGVRLHELRLVHLRINPRQ